MDFDWNAITIEDNGAADNNLPKIQEVEIVAVTEWDSVASEVHDQFQRLNVAERKFKIGGVEMEAGDFVIGLLKANSLTHVMTLLKHILSHHKTLEGANTMEVTHKFHYVDERSRVKIRKVGELDIPNASPTQISEFCGNGRILIMEDAIFTAVFSATFSVGNVLSTPSPVVTNTTRKLKTISSDSLVAIGDKHIPHANLSFLWGVHAKKQAAQGKVGNRNVADIPWVAVGEMPRAVRDALLFLFGDLSSTCKDFKEDFIGDVPGYMYAAAWVSKLLTKESKHRAENGSLTIVLSHLRKFYATWSNNPGSDEFGAMSTLATQAGKVLAGCRDVRGKDNPGLEYSSYSVLPNLPWAFVGAARHRMIFGGVKFKPAAVLHHTDSMAMFPNSKVVSGKVSGWEETFKKTDHIFVVGEDIYANDMFGIVHTKTKIIEELAGLMIVKYLVETRQHSGMIALRLLLPKNAATFEEFVKILNSLRKVGGLMIVPSVTPHNLECYLFFSPAHKAQTSQEFSDIVLTRLYHTYMTSISVNFARTVSYCLLIPGTVGSSIFYGPFVNEWIACTKATLSRDFFIDVNSKMDVYRRATFDVDDNTMYEVPEVPRIAKRVRNDKDAGTLGINKLSGLVDNVQEKQK